MTGVLRGEGGDDNVLVPTSKLAQLPGINGEHLPSRTRENSLQYLKKQMGKTGKLPEGHETGKEYAPFVQVDQDGKAWVNEGNHRIKAANELGWNHLPTEVRYFNGGESVPGPWHPDTLLADHARLRDTPRVGLHQGNEQVPEEPSAGSFKGDLADHPQTQTPEFKAWSKGAPLVTKEDANDHEFKTGQPVVVEAFHGTGRPDRVGDTMRRSRATSGPMPYHTSSPKLASSYATGKQDTSLAYENTNYENWFKYRPPGARNDVPIDRMWHHLDPATRQKIYETAPTLHRDDDGNIVSTPGNKSGNGGYDQHIKEARGNPLKALTEEWLSSGNLFGDEDKFMDVLQKAGVPKGAVKYDSPHDTSPAVYRNYVRMSNPLVTSDLPKRVVDALDTAAKYDRSKPAPGGADMWDKNTRTLRDWVKEFHRTEGENSHVWTSIPDKVTKVLKSLGYDGIVDKSGKGGGDEHPVYVPFTETQVKSAIGNKGKFDPNKKSLIARNDPAQNGALA